MAQEVTAPRKHTMKKVKLGSEGLEVSQLGFGCMGMTTAYATVMSEDAIVALLKHVHEQQITHFDTATLYMYLNAWRLLTLRSPIVHQEEHIGKALKAIGREQVQLATKTGIKMSMAGKMSACGDPAFVRREAEACLARLDTPYIDLFYLHRIDQTIPIEKTMRELKKLVGEGKIKYVGLSEAAPATIRRAHAIHPISAVQVEWSLFERGIEAPGSVLDTCRELGIGIVAYSPLGRGFLSAGFEKLELKQGNMLTGDYRNTDPRLGDKDNLAQNIKLAKELQTVADRKQCSLAQLALAWLMQDHWGVAVCPIPGTTKAHRVDENAASCKIVLSEADLAEMDRISKEIAVAGGRYNGEASELLWEVDKNPIEA
ncbi:putative aldo-keto reductase 1 [Porphyridium purpureum]|uniref:Putative aldo-keto reductase 1 n=1 Tax=Porphyridium purpureum TaxID=35688 RepID=A0A5J4YVL3_PORPP|nr:putative aldo-keto reductase 1 [Porphyridium purpureum]|eukprot:POR4612..scf227_4